MTIKIKLIILGILFLLLAFFTISAILTLLTVHTFYIPMLLGCFSPGPSVSFPGAPLSLPPHIPPDGGRLGSFSCFLFLSCVSPLTTSPSESLSVPLTSVFSVCLTFQSAMTAPLGHPGDILMSLHELTISPSKAGPPSYFPVSIILQESNYGNNSPNYASLKTSIS